MHRHAAPPLPHTHRTLTLLSHPPCVPQIRDDIARSLRLAPSAGRWVESFERVNLHFEARRKAGGLLANFRELLEEGERLEGRGGRGTARSLPHLPPSPHTPQFRTPSHTLPHPTLRSRARGVPAMHRVCADPARGGGAGRRAFLPAWADRASGVLPRGAPPRGAQARPPRLSPRQAQRGGGHGGVWHGAWWVGARLGGGGA